MLYEICKHIFWHLSSFLTNVYTKRVNRVFATFSSSYQHRPTLNLKTLIGGCLDEFIADVLTDIAYCIICYFCFLIVHIIHIYDPCHEVCVELGP